MQTNGPEHNFARLPLIEKLKALGWDNGQLLWSPEWLVPQTPSDASKREEGEKFKGFPVDVAIFDSVRESGSIDNIVGICETKSPDKSSGIHQLQIYMNMEPNARFGIWFNGTDFAVVYRTADGKFKIDRNPAKLIGPYDQVIFPGNHRIKFDDLEVTDSKTLKSRFRKILEIVVGRDTITTRNDERLNQVCNLLLAKLWSDKAGAGDSSEPLMFQVWSTEDETATKIREIFSEDQGAHGDLFTNESEKDIKLSNHTIYEAAYEISRFKLKDISVQVFAEAFQIFRSASSKNEEGQYYTPYPVIRSCVKLMDITSKDLVIDPACGTGGFVTEAFKIILDKSGKVDEARDWARRHLYAIDRDKINIKLTKALMLIIGDGSTHTYLGDSLRKHLWKEHYPDLLANIKDGKFTAIITNPPFGKNLKLSAREGESSGYTISKKPKKSSDILGDFHEKKYESRELGIAFVERCYELLMVGGRLGIILPETYMFSPSYQWLHGWMSERFILRAMVNIPMEAFQGFCRAKTNFYVFEKRGV